MLTNSHHNSLSEAHQKREEYATDIEKFLTLIEQLNEHQAELQQKVSTLTSEKTTMEQQMQECDTKITQLKDTIGSQELSVDDVRKMERQKVRVEEQLQQKRDVLDGHENALKEAQEKWLKCFQLLQQTVDEYNSKGTSLELIPENAKLAKGQKLEIRLDEERALDGIVEMMGGVDVANVVKPYVQKLTEDYKSEAFNEKERVVELKENIESMESLSEQLAEDIEVR